VRAPFTPVETASFAPLRSPDGDAAIITDDSLIARALLRETSKVVGRQDGETLQEQFARIAQQSATLASSTGVKIYPTRGRLKSVVAGVLEYVAEAPPQPWRDRAFESWMSYTPVPAWVSAVVPSGGTDMLPKSIHEAMLVDPISWAPAISEELAGMHKMNVFECVTRADVPSGHRIIDMRALFTVKRNANGEIVRHKTRFVVRGFMQREEDLGELHASVVKMESLRVLFALAASENMQIYQLDVQQAFLHAELTEPVFVTPPVGLYDETGVIWRLRKSVYGLREAPHLFNKFLDGALREGGHVPTQADPCIYVKRTADSVLYSGVFVDDVVCVTLARAAVDALVAHLRAKEILVKDLGVLQFALGLRVAREPDGDVTVSQTAYVQSLLQTVALPRADKLVDEPFPATVVFIAEDSPASDELRRRMSLEPYAQYRSLIGGLLYLCRATRPDISLAVNLLARYVSCYGERHWRVLCHLLRYVKRTAHFGLRYWSRARQDGAVSAVLPFVGGHNVLVGFSDADWASVDLQQRRSTSGFVLMLNGAAVSWSVKRQTSVALSTCEAEYVALVEAVKEVVWMRLLLSELGFKQDSATIVFEDNQSTIRVAENPVLHGRSKHIDIRFHYTRQVVAENVVSLVYLDTRRMLADIFTKPLPERLHAPLSLAVLGYNGLRSLLEFEVATRASVAETST